MENKDQPAFSCPESYNPNNNEANGMYSSGLTKREFIAAKILQGIVSESNTWRTPNVNSDSLEDSLRLQQIVIQEQVAGALRYTDELLKQLSNE